MTPDLVQGKWDSFSACEDVHVLAGTLKLFLRELPQPLLPSCLHAELRSAAMGHGAAGADIVTSMTTVLAKVECPTQVVYLQATAIGITTSDCRLRPL